MKKLYHYILLAVPILLLQLPFGVKAEPILQYQNINIGDTPDKVLRLAVNEFANAKLRPRKYSFDTINIVAGDNRGMIDNSCAYAATSTLQKNCLSVRFIFASEAQGNLLNNVFVEQSFNPAINRESLVNKLIAKYGKPRLTSEDTIPAGYLNPESKFISLLWGGDRTPPGIFRPSGAPSYDREMIGGKYISVVIHYQGILANGYSLRIVDSEMMNESIKAMMTEIERLKAAERTENEGSVKF